MRLLDRLSSLLEYVLAFLYVRGGIVVIFFTEPALSVPAIITLLAGQGAIYVYGVVFLFLGIALVYSKLRNRKSLHKWILLSMFFVSTYIFFLAAAVNGVTIALWLPLLSVFMGGFLYLRWKMRTEYISVEEFRKTSSEAIHERN